MSLFLKKFGDPVMLGDLEPGSLFFFENTLCVKAEYRTPNGAVEAVIVGTGEAFWGGTSKPEDQLRLIVQPVRVFYDYGGSINSLVHEAHQNAIDKGWYEEPRTFGELIALMHSELSEALEDHRNGRGLREIYYEGDKPCGIPIELADTVIRIFDTCGHLGINLEAAIREKMAYNATRPRRHGGKKL